MSIETELTKKEIQQVAEKMRELTKRTMLESDMVTPKKKEIKHTMLESDMVTPKKKEIKGSDTELKAKLAEATNCLEPVHTAEGLSLRDLTDREKQRLRNIGMTSANIEKCKVDKMGAFHLDCRNSNMEGTRHPVTGVCFERKLISINDVKIEGVFPKFQSVTELRLPEKLYRATEGDQFRYLNARLREEVHNNPSLQDKFTEQQLQMIEKGYNPTGYTWHHNESCGTMQLVETAKHAATGHTGGDSIWGGR